METINFVRCLAGVFKVKFILLHFEFFYLEEKIHCHRTRPPLNIDISFFLLELQMLYLKTKSIIFDFFNSIAIIAIVVVIFNIFDMYNRTELFFQDCLFLLFSNATFQHFFLRNKVAAALN